MPGHKFYGTKEWQKLRAKVRERAKNRCENCGASCRGKHQSQVDHKLPVRDAPSRALDITNLWLLCRTCHMTKNATAKNHPNRPAIGLDGFPVDGSWS